MIAGRLIALAAFVLPLAIACSSSTDDASSGDSSSKCCPISAPPTSCNYAQMGGSRARNPDCPSIIDNVPPLYRFVDEDGCPAYGGPSGQSSTPVEYANDCPKRDASSD